ncbi:MAG: response regulator transcription factor [Peptococcaceae bacterium]|jgi:DNA-binding response OmpR family regulator|nr:response regulator transcription factor [Peptococcaceae bacterium]MDH7524330.1 response regulator transcription factor [Peptococcaceae bacterium]
MTKVLVVDDEASIVELVKYNLEKAGFRVECLDDGLKAVKRIMEVPPDLLILDLMLPGMDGLDVCRHLRQQEKTRLLPIIILTARVEEIDRVVGLELGADDYLTKPFSPRELVARVKSILRRSQGSQTKVEAEPGPIVRGPLKIYPDRYEAVLDGEVLELTPKEFQLLVQLAANQGKVYTREFLLENIWGYEYPGDTRTVDVHIRHLRQKLEKNSGQPVLIETIRGIGYRFKG